MKKVLLVEPIHEDGINLLNQEVTVEVSKNTDPGYLASVAGDFSGIVIRTSPLPSSVIEAASRLEVIGRHGIGLDNIDMAAVRKRGIAVVNVPDANALSVAEYVLGAILLFARRFIQADREVRGGTFFEQGASLPGLAQRLGLAGMEAAGKTLGIIGFGRIGRILAKKAIAALDMKVIVYDPLVAEETGRELGVTVVNDLRELLGEADFVSLHVPLTKETAGLIGLGELKGMKPGAYLINASRGGVVNEEDLTAALKGGIIAGAAVDVFSREPLFPENPLFTAPNVIMTPHTAGVTKEAARRMAVSVAEGVLDALRGKRPRNLVFPQEWPNRKQED